MHISPRTSPDDVLRVYRELRKDLLIQQRDRDLSEKKLRLVEFVMENPDKSDHDLHLEWNRSRYPKDQFEQLGSSQKR